MDNNVGIKISLPGYEVRSATPEQCSMDSIYDTFKLKLSSINDLFGLVTIFFNVEPPTPATSNTINLFKVAHGYNYQPYIITMDIDSTFSAFSQMSTAVPFVNLNGGTFFTNVGDNTTFITHADNTYFYIDLFIDSGKTFPLVGKFYTFKYYIFSENGF